MKFLILASLSLTQFAFAAEKSELKRMPANADKGEFVCGHSPTSPNSSHEFLNRFCDNSKAFTVTHVKKDLTNNLEGIIVCCVQK